MRLRSLARLAASLLFMATLARAQQNPAWTTPLAPFRIADNLYYVGSEDLASFLVTTPAGNILINANLESSPPQIRKSVEQLGFRWDDTKILLNSQAHFDHVAGAAEVLGETHARNEVMDGDAALMESGGRIDFDKLPPYPPAHVDRVLHDGDQVTLGGVTLTAHKTAGHTRGCTTWTMRVHVPGEPAGKLRDVVIIGGMAALSDYRVIDRPGHAASYPGIAHDFEKTFATLNGLPCDIFLGAHGVYFGMKAKLARMPAEGDRVWIDPEGYRSAVAEAKAAFGKDLTSQQASAR